MDRLVEELEVIKEDLHIGLKSVQYDLDVNRALYAEHIKEQLEKVMDRLEQAEEAIDDVLLNF